MKKTIYTLAFVLFFIFLGGIEIKASSGMCIISQQNLTYEVNTPFYWYHATYENLFNDAMVSTENYYHTYTLIQGKEACEGITGNTPTYERGINQNNLSSRTTSITPQAIFS